MEKNESRKKYPRRQYEDGKSPMLSRTLSHNCLLACFGRVKEAVGEEVWSAIKESSVGVIAKLVDSDYVWSAKIVHYLLTRQLSIKRNEIWSVVGRQPIRFSLHEFGEITGLNTDPLPTATCEGKHYDFWKELGVSSSEGPKYDELVRVFGRSQGWTFEKKKMLGLLCILHVGIYGLHHNSRLPLESAKRVINDADMENYPWGRVAFESLMRGLNVIECKGKSFTVSGCVHALLIWAYESVVVFGEQFGNEIKGSTEVPFLRWVGKRTRSSLETVINKEIAKYNGVRVRPMIVKELNEIYPHWEGEEDDPELHNLIVDLLENKFEEGYWDVKKTGKQHRSLSVFSEQPDKKYKAGRVRDREETDGEEDERNRKHSRVDDKKKDKRGEKKREKRKRNVSPGSGGKEELTRTESFFLDLVEKMVDRFTANIGVMMGTIDARIEAKVDEMFVNRLAAVENRVELILGKVKDLPDRIGETIPKNNSICYNPMDELSVNNAGESNKDKEQLKEQSKEANIGGEDTKVEEHVKEQSKEANSGGEETKVKEQDNEQGEEANDVGEDNKVKEQVRGRSKEANNAGQDNKVVQQVKEAKKSKKLNENVEKKASFVEIGDSKAKKKGRDVKKGRDDKLAIEAIEIRLAEEANRAKATKEANAKKEAEATNAKKEAEAKQAEKDKETKKRQTVAKRKATLAAKKDAQKKAEQEKAAQEKAAQEKAAQEKAAQEKAAHDKLEKELNSRSDKNNKQVVGNKVEITPNKLKLKFVSNSKKKGGVGVDEVQIMNGADNILVAESDDENEEDRIRSAQIKKHMEERYDSILNGTPAKAFPLPYPFIGQNGLTCMRKNVDPGPGIYDPLAPYDTLKLELVINCMKPFEHIPLDLKEVKQGVPENVHLYRILITERENWPCYDYGWLEDSVIASYMRVLHLRQQRDPYPFHSSRIAFIDQWFSSSWAFVDYKQYNMNPKNWKFSPKWFDLANGLLPERCPSRKKWFYDVDHLFIIHQLDGCHWVALHVDLLKEKIYCYDSIIAKGTREEDNGVLNQCRAFTRMIPHLLNEYIPEEDRKKTYQQFTFWRRKGIPQNKKVGDCGVYALKYIECLALGVRFDGLEDENMEAIRYKMATELFEEAPDLDNLLF